jgi:hypothetical protein
MLTTDVYISKYHGRSSHLHPFGRKITTDWHEDNFPKVPSSEEYSASNGPLKSSRPLANGNAIDDIAESDHRDNPRLERIEDMVLNPEHAIFKLILHTNGTVDHCGIQFSMADVTVFVRSEAYNEMLEFFHDSTETAGDGVRALMVEGFWKSVLAASFIVKDGFLASCTTCRRIFYSPLTKRNRLSICQYCLDKYVTKRCNDREDRVMKEVSGHIVGLSTDDELRTFSDVMKDTLH